MPKTSVNGIEMYYEVAGEGDPVLLIAGYACDHSIWFKIAPKLAAKYRVITFDNRGMGQTDAPDSPYTIRQMADDAAALLETLNISSAHIAGHSMGGQIAQEFTLAYPNRVRSLMLLSSCARGDWFRKAIIESWGELPRMVDAAMCARLMFPWLYTSYYYANPGAVQQLIEQMLAYPFQPTPHGMYHQSRAVSTSNTLSRLGEIACNTLVLVGREDLLLPVQFSEVLAKGIRAAELVVLEKTAHGFLIESPDAVLTAMLSFLSKQSVN